MNKIVCVDCYQSYSGGVAIKIARQNGPGRYYRFEAQHPLLLQLQSLIARAAQHHKVEIIPWSVGIAGWSAYPSYKGPRS